ncbi:BCSC C-terminal domain-containing protein [Pseudoalteromonas sp. MMG010]|uniref:cellulose synthase subunit BcsC-related outer membrane protein n=1 Tax=Pseudoalteromonas sp. MMG010 TaxID=2822685 RepID=UPI001B39F70C|nr:cellulose synthase subunit BcsC-related outer membrane protein [Pseudoalteromonas sp. MMG010]MBQ4833100.1 BCSC C-terminal domain-containing protein [Pseudoalteromonas sp. MMG010]
MSVRPYLILCALFSSFCLYAVQSKDIDSDPVHWLVSQIALGEAKQNEALISDSLQKLIAIAPRRIETLCAQAHYELTHNNIGTAKNIYTDLQKHLATTHSCVKKVEQLIRISTTAKATVERAKNYAAQGDFEKASALYTQIFNGTYPTLTYQLQHLDWQAQDLSQWQAVNRSYMQLRLKFKKVGQIDIAYARHLLRKNPNNIKALNILNNYRHADNFTQEVEDIWLNALQNMPINEHTYSRYQSYLSAYPFSNKGENAFTQFKSLLDKQQHLLADPAYQAWLKGNQLLEENNLSKAEPLLLKAYQTRNTDSKVLRSLGLLYLKRNNNQQALTYFNQALQYTVQNSETSELKTLANTAKFWLYIQQAKAATKKSDFTKAQLKINLARTINLAPNTVLFEQGQLFVAQGKYAQAETIFYRLLNVEPENKNALTALLAITQRDEDERHMVNFYNNLAFKQQVIVKSQYQQALSSKLRKSAQLSIEDADVDQAIKTLQYSIKSAPSQAWPYYDLALIYQQQGLTDKALALYKTALTKYQNHPTLHYTYALFLNSIERYTQALTSLNTLPKNLHDDDIKALIQQLKTTELFAKADNLTSTDDKNQIIYQLSYLQAQPLSPLLKAKLSQSWYKINENLKAISLLKRALEEQPTLASFWHNLYGQWLLQHADSTATMQWFEHYTLANSASEKEVNQYITLANAYYARFYKGSELIAKLNQLDQTYKQNPLTAAALIKTHLALGNDETATIIYQTKIQKNLAFNSDTQLSIVKAYKKLNKPTLAQPILKDVVAQSASQPSYFQQQIMSSLFDLTDESHALAYAQQLVNNAPDDQALAYLAAKLADSYHNQALANMWYQQTLSPKVPLNETQLHTELSVIDDTAPWYITNAKQALIEQSKKNQAYIAVGVNFSNQSNSENELTTDTTMVPIEGYFPLWQGHGFVKLDPITLKAQTNYFDQLTSGSQYGQGALCIFTCNESEITPEQNGIDVGIGWENEHWRFDIGTTPLGFLVEDIVWGLRYTDSFNDFNWQIELEKRPVTDSVLSYAGLTDVNTNSVWGGVRTTGITLNGGYNINEQWGLWSAIDYQFYAGLNVLDNQRYRLMGGAFYKAIKNQQRELTLGVNLFHWAYQYNLSEQTYGHGGYYSPQSYIGISLPFTYDARVGEDFVYRFKTDLGVAKSDTNASNYFPNDPLLQASAILRESETGISPVFEASSRTGLSYKLEGSFEYRITPHWFFGGAFALERADYYEPNSGQLYIRYFFDPVYGQLSFPAEPIIPYSDY